MQYIHFIQPKGFTQAVNNLNGICLNHQVGVQGTIKNIILG